VSFLWDVQNCSLASSFLGENISLCSYSETSISRKVESSSRKVVVKKVEKESKKVDK
jgi:hypothetical protein